MRFGDGVEYLSENMDEVEANRCVDGRENGVSQCDLDGVGHIW